MSEEYENLTVAQLKELLREQGLMVSGNKSVLIERLSADATEAAPADDDSAEDDGVADEVAADGDDTQLEEQADDEDDEDEEDEDDDDFDYDDLDDEWDDDEPDFHVAKQKPRLSDEIITALELRKAQSKATPKFRRTEWYRYKRLSHSGWRAPKGMQNKQRMNLKYRSAKVRIGFGKVNSASGLHPSGFAEVMVHNPLDLEAIDPEIEAARIGATVGGRKRQQIHSRADELGIRILNRRRNL